MSTEYIIGGETGEVPGAKRYSCTYCRSDAWIGPASIKMLGESPETRVICLECYLTNPKVPHASAEETCVSSRDELVEALGTDTADFLVKNAPKIFAALRKKPPFEPWKKN